LGISREIEPRAVDRVWGDPEMIPEDVPRLLLPTVPPVGDVRLFLVGVQPFAFVDD
jgi:hypothetical protein